MPRELLLATRNHKKKLELQEILHDLNLSIITLEELPPMAEVEEDGNTFAENAIKKAVFTAMASGRVCLADDSGLVVDALGGQPGIYSARFAGELANDEENNQKLLKLMETIEEDKRTARFVCVIALSDAQGNVETVEGRCEGRIALAPVGKGGFGYDPLFIPQGDTQSFAELPPPTKNLISHRGKALRQARPLIERLFRGSN
ncbi:MAG: XTP/dITP diphosphatase [Syntrophomonas sp.]|uniref:XTP/dITP diphosphatase n=1 Tax=Syntrophomonas sp. TaxID=2053627 RepID=UPI00263385AB|nr:XTP/dITP diphosphatase [Syntrophomonas sp.]MDD2510673.1 XTP/dITP diphosphatase [Syntrophomonas sp.]MDD3878711.1 XTP/dITP diphosphatase [Syntrophomonas sp.]MDD4626153.1 XTP/dITP diphosphatase [Syntrophomonas sp.]